MVCEVFDNPLTQVLLAAALLASVDLELVKVSIVAVGEGSHLDPSLHWLQWHVLFQGGVTCELDHRFVNRYLLVGIVEVREARRKMVDHRPHLTKPVITSLGLRLELSTK